MATMVAFIAEESDQLIVVTRFFIS